MSVLFPRASGVRFDIERTSTAVWRRSVIRVTPGFGGAGNGRGAAPATEGGGEGAGDEAGAKGRKEARENAEDVRNRWNGSGSVTEKTCEAGTYNWG